MCLRVMLCVVCTCYVLVVAVKTVVNESMRHFIEHLPAKASSSPRSRCCPHSLSVCPPRVRKILNLRLFPDENDKAWSKSVMDLNYEVLCVSQFTLQCVLKGNKPDFHLAMPSELAQPFYDSIVENMRSSYKPELIKGEWRSDSPRSSDPLLAFLLSCVRLLFLWGCELRILGAVTLAVNWVTPPGSRYGEHPVPAREG